MSKMFLNISFISSLFVMFSISYKSTTRDSLSLLIVEIELFKNVMFMSFFIGTLNSSLSNPNSSRDFTFTKTEEGGLSLVKGKTSGSSLISGSYVKVTFKKFSFDSP